MGATSGEFAVITEFQYRKRYEVYCNLSDAMLESSTYWFQYRKRYEVYCNKYNILPKYDRHVCFNTASGMRSIAMDAPGFPLIGRWSFNTASGMRSIAIPQ